MPPSLSFNRPNKTRAFLLCGIFPVQKSEGLLIVECKKFSESALRKSKQYYQQFRFSYDFKAPIFFFFCLVSHWNGNQPNKYENPQCSRPTEEGVFTEESKSLPEVGSERFKNTHT